MPPYSQHEVMQCGKVRLHHSFMHILFEIYEIITNETSLRKWFDKHHAEKFFWERSVILKEKWLEHFLPKTIKSSSLIVFRILYY